MLLHRATVHLDGIASSLTAFFSFDILLNFSMNSVEMEQLVMKRRSITRDYLRVWSWIDLVAMVPWDVMIGRVDFVALVRLPKASRMLKTLRYLKELRLVRLIKMTGPPAGIGASSATTSCSQCSSCRARSLSAFCCSRT